LIEIVIVAGIDVAVARRNNARRHGRADAEGVTDRHHPIADPGVIAVAEMGGGKRLFGHDFQQRQIGLGIAAHHPRRHRRAVLQGNGDLVAVLDHMIVGDDITGRVDDEAGAQRGDMTRPVGVGAQEILEQIFQG
jgi:hypothetical protein